MAADKLRRTFADLLGEDPVPLLPDGECSFCRLQFKDNSRTDLPTQYGGVRRITEQGLACDPCIVARGTTLLPSMRKHAALEQLWIADVKVEGAA